MTQETTCGGPWCPVFGDAPCLEGEELHFELEEEDYEDFDRVIMVVQDMAAELRHTSSF